MEAIKPRMIFSKMFLYRSIGAIILNHGEIKMGSQAWRGKAKMTGTLLKKSNRAKNKKASFNNNSDKSCKCKALRCPKVASFLRMIKYKSRQTTV